MVTYKKKLNGSRLEQVNMFQYFGSMITEDPECSKEIRGKLARGQSAETGMKQIWKSHNIKLASKVRLMKALVHKRLRPNVPAPKRPCAQTSCFDRNQRFNGLLYSS